MGPTNNPVYNKCLVEWAKLGCESRPECEACGKDLLNQDVVEWQGTEWRCTECANEEPAHIPYVNWREDFHSDI